MKTLSSLSRGVIIFIFCGFITACNNKPKAPEAVVALQQESPVNIQSKIYNAKVINFAGFGPAKFGDNEESVRMSWGSPLRASEPQTGATCYYLYQDPMPESLQDIAFMLEEGQFVRYDIDDPKWVAPGDIVVGDSAQMVMQAHVNRVENHPHKYIHGAHTLIVTPVEQSDARLIFETDADNMVVSWRIGVSPQVYYVESCS